MKNLKFKKLSSSFRILLIGSCLASVFLEISGLPQWVWNKDAIDNTRFGNNNNNNNQQFFSGHSSNFPVSPPADPPRQSIRIVDGQSRLFSNAISSVSNSLQSIGGGGSGSGGGSNPINGILGAVIQTIPQLVTQGISGIFAGNRPINLPAKNPDSVDTGPVSPVTGACKCVSNNSCFLPSKPNGSCDGGKVKCCSTSRTLFPDEDPVKKDSGNERNVRIRDVRRGLLQSILKGSGNVVDDTLDLILTPYLTSEDQQKIATRVIDDGN